MKIRWIRTGSIIVAVYLGMKYLLPVVLPFFIALSIAKLLYPLALHLETECKFRHMIACSVVFLGAAALVCLALAGLLYLCYHSACSCPVDLQNICAEWMRLESQLFQRLRELLGSGAEPMIAKLQEIAGEVISGVWDCSKNMSRVLALLGANIVVTVIASFLILQDYQKIRQKILENAVGRYLLNLVMGIKKAVGAYVKAELKIMLLIMGICIAGMLFINRKYAVLLGIIIGLFDALPFVGTGIILIPWALFQLFVKQYGKMFILFLLYLICTFTRQLLEPKLVAKGVGVHPLAVLISIYIGIYVYGIAGVLLGPLSALLIGQILKN